MTPFFLMMLVLYGIRKHGTGEPLSDFSQKKISFVSDWAKNGILYQIYPRAFTAEGTLYALKTHLNHIKALGITIVWLMPLFPIGKKGRKGQLGSPYSIRDFRKVNPEYGTENDFRDLVKEIHNIGMKVIIGMVPNHGSNDNVLMQDHPGWFRKNEKGKFSRRIPEWSDVTDFNYDNPDLREYMTDTFCYWVKEFDVDGFRMDVAGMVPLDFWESAINKLKQIKPDVYLLAEWEDPEILLKGFHSDYDWTLYYLLKDLVAGKITPHEIVQMVYERDRLYPQNGLPMRFLENHDEERAVSVFGPDISIVLAGLLFTLPGIPLIYAGQELGEIEKPSLFETSELNWNNRDWVIINFYKALVRLRKSLSCFTDGELIPIRTNYDQVGAFIRKNNQSVALIVVNLASEAMYNVHLAVPENFDGALKLMKRLFSLHSYNRDDLISKELVSIPALEFMIYGAER